jgi:hypothetical protein
MSEATKPLTAERERLPNRRPSENFSFELHGIRYHATLGRYPDGRPGEIFNSSHKAGSAADVAARDAAIAISFALQFGASLEDIGRAMSRSPNGMANGPIGLAIDLLAATCPPQPFEGARND